jgi:uncharacterized protein (TIGR02246 family)
MNDSDTRAVERLLSDFAWNADHGDGDGLGALFVPEATLVVGGQQLAGRAAIAADCNRRASQPGRKVRHMWSNLRLDGDAARGLSATAVQMTFEQMDGQQGTRLRINDLVDTFVRDAEGRLRFASREIRCEMSLEL